MTRVAESEDFGWSRIFLSDSTPDVQLDHFFHHTLNWEFLLKLYNFF